MTYKYTPTPTKSTAPPLSPQPHGLELNDCVAPTGALQMWSRAVGQAMEKAAVLLPPGSSLIEIGYGDGLLSCYLAQRYGWKITGYDCSSVAHAKASANRNSFGLWDQVSFDLIEADETWRLKGEYDGVFIKTVLCNAHSLKEYARWLDWVLAVLRPGGTFVNFENGKANRLTYLYRTLRKRYYKDLCMYDSEVQNLYAERFTDCSFAHYGGFSQFASIWPLAYRLLSSAEEQLMVRTADNSFLTAIVARKPNP